MKTLLSTVAVACSMFSALPMPRVDWTPRNLRYALCAFPLVGAAVGLCWWGWAAVSGWLDLGGLLRAAGFCLLPVFVTGGIHLDGYADTCDALASHAAPEKKQDILKDPRCGAFAVIRLCVYFVAYLALLTEFSPTDRAIACMGLAFVLSRTLSGWAIAALPLARDTGLAHTFASHADRRRVGAILLCAAVALALALCLLGRWTGLAMAAAGGVTLWRYAWVAKREFGGISGDLAGWFLQKAEIWMLAALVACQRAEALGWF